MFHVQAKQNLSAEEGDGCRGGGEGQGGVTVPGEREPGEHERFIDMQLTAQCSLCVCVCARACKAQWRRDVGCQKGGSYEVTERYLRNRFSAISTNMCIHPFL